MARLKYKIPKLLYRAIKVIILVVSNLIDHNQFAGIIATKATAGTGMAIPNIAPRLFTFFSTITYKQPDGAPGTVVVGSSMDG